MNDNGLLVIGVNTEGSSYNEETMITAAEERRQSDTREGHPTTKLVICDNPLTQANCIIENVFGGGG